jgi:hypothetical protein
LSVRLLFAVEACRRKEEGEVRRQAFRLAGAKQSPCHAAVVNGWSASTPVDPAFSDGAYRDRTGDLRLAKPALSQLS